MWEENSWIVLSLLTAIASAFTYLINQYYKLPGHYLAFWSRAFVLLGFLPFLFSIDWPDNPQFYIAVSLTAGLAVLGDIRFYNVVAEYGGGVASRVQPLMIWVAFILWLFFEPQQIFDYLNNPVKLVGVMGSMVGCVYFASHLNKCNVSKDAFIRLFPAICGYGVNMVLAKYAFNHSSLHGGVFAYMVVQSVMTFPFTIYFLMKDKKNKVILKNGTLIPKLNSKVVIAAGALLYVGWMSHMVFKNYANSFVENPGYVAALMLTTPIWISLIYKVIGHKEEANVKFGMGIVACSIALSFFSTL